MKETPCLKKSIVFFPIFDLPYQNMCDPNLFYGFSKKKKKIIIIIFKGEGGQKGEKKIVKLCTDQTCMEVNLVPGRIKKNCAYRLVGVTK